MTNRSYLETAYKLKQNPFANLVDPNVEMAGRLKEKQQWTEIVETRKDTNANTMCFILGDYGFGKTLTLNKIVEQYKDDPDVLPIFMKMLPEDKVIKFGVDFIQRIFRQVPQSIFESFSLNDLVVLEKTGSLGLCVVKPYMVVGSSGKAAVAFNVQIEPLEQRCGF